jgi:hypothetical protein
LINSLFCRLFLKSQKFALSLPTVCPAIIVDIRVRNVPRKTE